MASVGANAHEQHKRLRRLSWCSYFLRIAASLLCASTRVVLCYWPRSSPYCHTRLVVGAIVAQHEEDLHVYPMQWTQWMQPQA
jgi:hypothetical protein